MTWFLFGFLLRSESEGRQPTPAQIKERKTANATSPVPKIRSFVGILHSSVLNIITHNIALLVYVVLTCPPEEARVMANPTVHFSPKVHIKTIPSLEDYSPEHIERIYHTKANLADRRKEMVATVTEMRRRHRRGEDPLQVHEVKWKTARPSTAITIATTTRGLEHLASAGTLEFHMQEKSNIIDAVLLAQEDNVASEEMALLYSRRARLACTRATRQGLEDAQHAHS